MHRKKKKTLQAQLYIIHLATKKELESQNYCSKNEVWIFSITKFINMLFVPKIANEKGLFELQLVRLFSKFLSEKKKTRLHLVFILHQILVSSVTRSSPFSIVLFLSLSSF